jgi:DNA-binding transcriptional ArsR family regulator
VRARGAAPLFAALGDATRLNLMRQLCDQGPRSIVQLTEGLAERSHVTRQAVSKHLLAMQRAGLVRSRRHGRERIWEIRQQRLADARSYLQDISQQWDEALQRLKSLVEPH